MKQVVRRPFAFIYNHEKDPVERAFINLGTARIEFNDEEIGNGTRVRQMDLIKKKGHVQSIS